MELASWHPSVAKNFEAASRFFENLWISVLKIYGVKVTIGLNKLTIGSNGGIL
jgi:hypothetical protein